MSDNDGLGLVAPQFMPPLDSDFRPAVLATHAFRRQVLASGKQVPVRLALQQADGSTSHFETVILPEEHPFARGNFRYLERITRLLLWSRGGHRIYFDGPSDLASKLAAYYRETPTGKFDSSIFAERMLDHLFEIVPATAFPAQSHITASL